MKSERTNGPLFGRLGADRVKKQPHSLTSTASTSFTKSSVWVHCSLMHIFRIIFELSWSLCGGHSVGKYVREHCAFILLCYTCDYFATTNRNCFGISSTCIDRTDSENRILLWLMNLHSKWHIYLYKAHHSGQLLHIATFANTLVQFEYVSFCSFAEWEWHSVDAWFCFFR